MASVLFRCTPVACPGSVRRARAWVRTLVSTPTPRQQIVANAAAKGPDSSSDPLQEPCPVPLDQRPMQELLMLQKEFLFDLPTLPGQDFAIRLASITAGFLLLSVPISCVTFSVKDELLQVVAASSLGSLFVTLVLVLRIYLGYNHVNSRLLSATVEYEETGWYDGEVWVKSPQMLMRDRLLGIYQVQPILSKVKQALLGLSGAMAAAIILLVTSPPPKAYSYNDTPSPRPTGSSYKSGSASELEYQARVETYEPWALKEGQAASAVADDVEVEEEDLSDRPSILDHMRSPRAQL